jgi:hypothetical protein
LMAGDHLKSHDGRWVILEAVVSNQETAPVYNLRVAEYHTYFVGGSSWGFSVWSHNANAGCTKHIDLTPAPNGSYTIEFSSGMTYAGKGGTTRARKSARRHSNANNDPVVSIDHTPATTNTDAFRQEAARLADIGGPGSTGNYNQIHSPGRYIP